MATTSSGVPAVGSFDSNNGDAVKVKVRIETIILLHVLTLQYHQLNTINSRSDKHRNSSGTVCLGIFTVSLIAYAHTDAREVPLVSLPGPSEADAQVQRPVASALEGLSGERVNLEVARPQPLGLSHFNSITMPIGAQVSPKIKAKIWANEFVEFGLLINPSMGDTRYQLSINQNDNSVPILSLEPSSRIKPINTIDLWTSAFQIFVGVYTSKFPQEAPSLMKYVWGGCP